LPYDLKWIRFFHCDLLILGDCRKSDKKEPFGTSNETSDFIADGLELWWEENKERHSHIKELVIKFENPAGLLSTCATRSYIMNCSNATLSI